MRRSTQVFSLFVQHLQVNFYRGQCVLQKERQFTSIGCTLGGGNIRFTVHYAARSLNLRIATHTIAGG